MKREDAANRLLGWLRVPTDVPKGLCPDGVAWHTHPSNNIIFPSLVNWSIAQFFALLFLGGYYGIKSAPDILMVSVFGEIVGNIDRGLSNIPYYSIMEIFPKNVFGIPFGMLTFLVEAVVTLALVMMQLRVHSSWYYYDAGGVGSREGINTVREKYIPFANIQTIRLKQGIIGGIFGYGRVEIITAGGDKQDDSKDAPKRAIFMRDVDKPAEVYNLLQDKLRAFQNQEQQKQSKPVPKQEITTLDAAKALLNEAKALTAQAS